jgi:hypothetical protein
MFNALIDTCVWLDIAENPKSGQLLDAVEVMLASGLMRLIVPRTILAEFKANRARVAKSSERSLSTHFNLVMEAVRKSDGNKRQKDQIIGYLSNADYRIPLIGGAAKATLDRVEKILNSVESIETCDAAKLRAADRALSRKAPCHQNKNSIADALLIETYFDCVKSGKPGERFAFVTHNYTDFSQAGGNRKLPHADLAEGFSKIKSLYFNNLADCFRRIDSHLLTDAMKAIGYDMPPRSLDELLHAMARLETQVWHNRHMNLQWAVDLGKHKVVSRKEWAANHHRKGYGQTHTVEEIWKGAQKARRRAERELGNGNHGPYSHFEWGMINGKLSAIRWALGDEWDMLDT